MYHGCDVWLNTPRRPLEACGTSGMKAALNGSLNCSASSTAGGTSATTARNGWAIESAEDDPDLDRRDQRECASLFSVLEEQVMPDVLRPRRRPACHARGSRWCSRRGRRSARGSPPPGWSATTRPRSTSRRPPHSQLAGRRRRRRRRPSWRRGARTCRASWPSVAITSLDVDADAGRHGHDPWRARDGRARRAAAADVRVEVRPRHGRHTTASSSSSRRRSCCSRSAAKRPRTAARSRSKRPAATASRRGSSRSTPAWRRRTTSAWRPGRVTVAKRPRYAPLGC